MNNFETEVFLNLCRKYPLPEWVCFEQLRVSTGYDNELGGDRTIDAFVINMYPSTGFLSRAIEFKRTIQDFNKDLSDPLKQAAIKFYSDEFYYLFPDELYQKHKQKLYTDCLSKANAGIMVVRDNCVVLERKPYHPTGKSPWSFGFVCSMVRNLAQKNL